MMKYLFFASLIFNVHFLHAQSLSLNSKYGVTDGRTENMHKLMYYTGSELSLESKRTKKYVFIAGIGISHMRFNSYDSVFNKIASISLSLSAKQYWHFSRGNAIYIQLGITNNVFVNTRKERISNFRKEIINSSERKYNIGGYSEIGFQVPIDPHYSFSIAVSDQRDLLFLNKPLANRFKTATIAWGTSITRRL